MKDNEMQLVAPTNTDDFKMEAIIEHWINPMMSPDKKYDPIVGHEELMIGPFDAGTKKRLSALGVLCNRINFTGWDFYGDGSYSDLLEPLSGAYFMGERTELPQIVLDMLGMKSEPSITFSNGLVLTVSYLNAWLHVPHVELAKMMESDWVKGIPPEHPGSKFLDGPRDESEGY